MTQPDEIDSGRKNFAERRWADAYRTLKAGDARQLLPCEDVERLATAAYLAGEDSEAVAAWTRAHYLHVDAGRLDRASYLGCLISLIWVRGGDFARATGWLSRTRRLLQEWQLDCPAEGYVRVLEGISAMASGGPADAHFTAAISIAQRFTDADLLALSLLGRGQWLVSDQRFTEGTTLLDESMIGVSSGDVSPIFAGIIYCAVILTCQRVFEIERAREWTLELDDWCTAQDGLRPFRGQCLVHRSQIMQQRGDWPAAIDEAATASQHLAGRSERVVGNALYQRGEIRRLQGAFDDAERLYAAAAASGYEPQPGASLLLLARGDPKTAATAIRGVLDVAGPPSGLGHGLSRPRILGPFVEIHLAAGNIDAAEAAAAELADWADRLPAAVLVAESIQARGAVLLAQHKPAEALDPLRTAWATWQRLEAPYESNRVRVLIGRATAATGDADAARLHFEAASAVFERLGAVPDVRAMAALIGTPDGKDDLGLSQREREVLAAVSAGATNREIAERLSISEHTVARHLSNIYDKLGVNSRTAASAVAHSNRLL